MRAGRKHTTEISRTPARSLRAGITSKVRRVTACGLTLLCALALVGGIGAQNALANEPADQATQAQDGQAVKNNDNGSTYTVAVPQDGGSGDIQVTVDAPEGSFSQDVTLKADLVQDEKDNNAVASELDKAEVAYDGFVALDVRFEDADGNEVEPAQPVDVKFELPAGVVPEDADPESVSVQHLAEDESGAVASVDTVADAADATDGVVAVAADDTTAVQAAFSVDGFSTFTITWDSRYMHYDGQASVVLWDATNNRELTYDGELEDIDLNSGENYTSNSLDSIIPKNIDGYTYSNTTVGYTGYNGNWQQVFDSFESISANYSRYGWTYRVNEQQWSEFSSPVIRVNYVEDNQGGGGTVTQNARVTTGKTADLREDGNYDLTLSVSGDRGTSENKQKVDILFILDTSGSMDDSKVSFNGQNMFLINALKSTLTGSYRNNAQLGGLIGAIDNNDNIDAQYSVVSFAGASGWHNGTDWGTVKVQQDWTSSANNTVSAIRGLSANGGTNYEQGILEGNRQLEKQAHTSRDATTFVIFVSDGEPTSYGPNDSGNGENFDNTALSRAQIALQNTDCDYFYAIGIGNVFENSNSNAYRRLDTLKEYVGDNVEGSSTIGQTFAASDDMTEVFDNILEDIEFFSAENVTLVDPLSDYADIVPEDDGSVEFVVRLEHRDENGEYAQVGDTQTVISGSSAQFTTTTTSENGQSLQTTFNITPSYDDESRTITAELTGLNGASYELAPDYRYSITTTITPSQTAINAGMGNPAAQQTPDDNTGTHSILGEDGQKDKGFWSNDNDNAKVTYTANNVSNLEAPFPKPVIQVQGPASVTIPAGGLEVTKSVDNWADLISKEFSFNVEAIATGEEGQDGYTSADDAAEFAWGKGYEGTTLEVDNGVESPSDIDLVHKGKALTLTSDMIGNTYSYVYTEDRDASRGKGYKPDDTAWKVTITVSEVNGELRAIAYVYRDAGGADEDGAYSWELCVWNKEDQVWGPTSDEENAGIDLTARNADSADPLIVLPFSNTTFDLSILKQDGSDKPLPHARFSVTLEDANGAEGTAAKDLEALDSEGTGSDGRMSFDGLMVGAVYKLEETYYPAGYEDGDPLLSKFIQVRYDENRRYVLHFVEKNNEGNWVPVSGSEGRALDEDGVTFTVTVKNNQIADLPTSGSSGTVILGAAGVAAVTVAAAYLASRKGMLPRLPR